MGLLQELLRFTEISFDAIALDSTASHPLYPHGVQDVFYCFCGTLYIGQCSDSWAPSFLVISWSSVGDSEVVLQHTFGIAIGDEGLCRHSVILILHALHIYVDVNQLQTFTHIALMTQCTDGSSVDLLTSLDQVGRKLAPIIFHLQRQDGLNNFMKHCCTLRSERLRAIPEKVVS